MTLLPVTQPMQVLLLEDEADQSEFLKEFLEAEGYGVGVATTLDEALALADTTFFHCVLADPATARSAQHALTSLAPLLARAQPTPVGIMTAWPLSEEAVREQGFAFLLQKPFDLDDLLITLANALRQPLTAEQERQAEVIGRYCAAINAKDLDTCLALCTEDVRIFPPAGTPFEGPVEGRAAYRAHLEESLALIPDFRYEEQQVYSRPRGLALRFRESWATPHGRASMMASLLLEFRGSSISQIGVQLNNARLCELLAAPLTAGYEQQAGI